MLGTYTQALANQFEAALCTLDACVARCPDDVWNAPVVNHAFCQVVFHTLFYADFYLGQNDASFRRQPFHREHQEVFADYEEFEDRAPTRLYGKDWIRTYLQHCRSKATEVMAAETDDTLKSPSGFDWLKFNRAELHVYTLRHILHHAAQLSLRLRADADQNVPWVKSGWRDLSRPAADGRQ